MARPSRLTAKTMTTIDEALDRGASYREAAAVAGVSHQTVATRAQKRRRRGTASSPEAEAAAAEVAALLDGPAPTGLEDVRQRIGIVRGLIGRLTPIVERDEYPATSYVTLCRYADELARVEVDLTPPAPKDPNEDPDVIEAERVLVSRVEKLIEAAEERRAREGRAR